ncbi:MAG: hypothetical protein PVG06_04130 [Desulfobacterales bacterium]
MTAITKKRKIYDLTPDVWIISKGRDSQFDLSAIEDGKNLDTVKEYQISDIARYLLNPNPIEVEKRLIGCEIHYPQRTATKIIQNMKRLFPRKLRKNWNGSGIPPEVLISNCKVKIPSLKDKDLESHLNTIYESLRAYDTVSKRLPQVDAYKIAHIIGICQDVGGNFSYLKLQGSIDDKLKYLNTYISKSVGVLLRKAHIADGLFEMRGFDFGAYDSGRSHRLVAYRKNGTQRCCVLNSNNKVDFALDDTELIKYMLLLEQSLKADANLKNAFGLCIRNQASPFKLFLNKQLEVDYSKSPFPEIYRKILQAKNIDPNQQNLIRPSLNYLQIGISFNYIPQCNRTEEKMMTLISVLHDLRALDTLRKKLPLVYDEIRKYVSVSEAGMFYLLDSIEGFNHDE